MANVGVIGAGSWGTALSVLLADNGHHVTIWSIDEKEVEMLDKKREHLTKLSGVKLSDGMTITGDLESAVKGKTFLYLQFRRRLQGQLRRRCQLTSGKVRLSLMWQRESRRVHF